MHKSYQNFQLAKAPEIKCIPWGVYCIHTVSPTLWHSTPQQLNNVNVDCVIDCIPKYPTHFDKMSECHSILCFLFSPAVYKYI